MKLIRDKKKPDNPTPDLQQYTIQETITSSSNITSHKTASITAIRSNSWKILIVDDEPEVHAVTKLSISDLVFEGKKIEFISALSAEQARSIFKEHPDIAVALVDVVMETEDAGLRLVEHVRKELGNQQVRLIIRTGQPGIAPERYVIDHYDIDDYKDKTELTVQRLYTALRTTLKIYRDMVVINHNRQGLEKILAAAPDLYKVQPMQQFLEGILTQIMSLCPAIGPDNLLVACLHKHKSPTLIQVGTGRFAHCEKIMEDPVLQLCQAILQRQELPESTTILPAGTVLLPLQLYEQTLGFIYLEKVISTLTSEDSYLLQIMTAQCAAALRNLELYTKLEQANHQNEQKNLFLGTAAHDLRNPLGIVLNAVGLLQKQLVGKFDNEQLQYLFWVQSSAQFALNLVNNLLDVAKIEAGHLEIELRPANLVAVVGQAVAANRLLATAKQVELTFHYEPPLPKIPIDSLKIQQLMNNLINNALKYTRPQTRVEITLRWQEGDVLISVIDQGSGIPKEELEKLFKPFSKTSVKGVYNEPGTGLGLLICRQVVEAHQGQIWVESEMGTGSTFYVLLPTKPQLTE